MILALLLLEPNPICPVGGATCVGNCLQDYNTNTLTRNPNFFDFIDHGEGSLRAQDYKGPVLSLLVF